MRRILAVVLPLAVVFAIALARMDGPSPKDVSAPPDRFSADRAMNELRTVLSGNVPHPVGTAANRRVRERIEARLRALGLTTSVQQRFSCNAGAVCAMVENLVARAPGPAQGDVLVLAAHYDSVGAGPGASDDGIGIATLLEVARATRGERFRNPIVYLITDGEEAGLLGAEAFVADETLSRDVAAVVNVEMRGTYGASNMFETSRGNRWLIRHLSAALERPQATSLFYAIYNLLPNDTDVSVFKRAGRGAVNFGGIRGVQWYHTPMDDLAHASPRTLQHHGDNVLATLRALGNADLAARGSSDASYFDVLQFFMVWWPQEWTIPMAVISLLLLVFAGRRTHPRGMTFGVLATFAALLVSALGGMAVAALARMRSGDIHFAADPEFAVAAMWLTGIAAALLSAALFNRREDAKAMLYGAAIVWHMVGIAVALAVPGAAYLFVVPALAVTACALANANETVTAAVASTAAAILFFPVGLVLYDALGSRLMMAVAIVIGMFATLTAPLFARMRNGLAAGVLAILCAIVAMLQPAATAERPRPLPLSYVDDPKAQSPLWITQRMTDSLRETAPFRQGIELLPWSDGDWTAPAPRRDLPRVTVEGARTGNRLTVRVRSSRGANRLVLVANGATVKRVNGTPLPPRPARFRDRMPSGWAFASAMGVPEMTVDLTATGPVEVIASDTTFAFPPEGAALQRARDASPAVTIQDGDVTITRARARF